jgi:hypothetical protein
MTTEDRPALSIVVTGRNDDYGRDFTARFIRTLAFNHHALTERGVTHEVVLVEWNPVAGKPFLTDIIRDALPHIAQTTLRSLIVDAAYQSACTQNPKLNFLEYLAKNVGVRRSHGDFVLATNTDIFFSRGLAQRLARSDLKVGTVYRAKRVDVKLGVDESRIGWDVLEESSNHVPRGEISPPLYQGAAGDFMLLDRESFHAVKGFNEVYRLARLAVDHNFLVKAYSHGLPIADIGSPVYHVSHIGSYQLSKNSLSVGQAEALWGARWHNKEVIYDNPETWGLSEAPVRQRDDRTTYLEFDWNAVPKLADLRRVVLPISRTATPAGHRVAPPQTPSDTTPPSP